MSLGSIRPYKNYEVLIDIFNELPSDAKLIIAGKSFSDKYLSKLKARVKTGNVLFYTQSIPGDDLSGFFSLARCSVYAFREVLTSGSVMLSLSYAVPAIVPDAGDLHYVVSDGVNGFRYHDAEELKKITKRIADMSSNDLHSLQTKTFNDILRYNCDDIARQTLAVYRWD
jgi:glycosyltransferase involved in cell wall biosynthesis